MSNEFNHFSQIADSLDQALQDVARQTASKGASYASAIAPKRTGFLANSIHVEPGDDKYSYKVVVGAPYGEFVEEGTRYQPPHPFLAPGIVQAQGDCEEALSSIEGRLGAGL